MYKILLLALPIFFHFSAFAQRYSLQHMVESRYRAQDTNDTYVNMLMPDLNGDGNPDLILEGGQRQATSSDLAETNQAVVLLGDSLGAFRFHSYFLKPSTAHVITDMADFNNDGLLDMVMYSFWNNGFSLYRGTSGGIMRFAPSPQFFATGTHGGPTRFSDYDGDGDLDILSFAAGSAAVPTLHIFDNSAGAFSRTSYQANFMMPENGFNFKIVDLNGDGRLDYGASDEGVMVAFLQQPNKTFVVRQTRVPQVFMSPAEFWDVNQDGLVDGVVLEEEFPFGTDTYLNLHQGSLTSGSGFFNSTPNRTITAPASYYKMFPFRNSWVSVVDVDTNGIEDVVAFRGNNLAVHYNPFNRPGGPSARVDNLPLSPGNYISNVSMKVADVNRDGLPDLITHAYNDSSGRRIRTFINQSQVIATKPFAESSAGLRIAPNPAHGVLTFMIPKGVVIEKTELQNSLGQVVLKEAGQATSLDVRHLPIGLYFLRAFTSKGEVLEHRCFLN